MRPHRRLPPAATPSRWPIPSRPALLLAALLCAAPALPGDVDVSPVTPPRPVLATGVTATRPAAPPPPEPVEATAPPRPATVTARRLAVRVDGAPSGAARQVHAVEGVTHATTVRLGRLAVGTDELVVAAVDPDAYRPFAPQVVADEPAVWDRLAEGDLVVAHEHAERLGVELGGQALLGGDVGVPVRVGALASTGMPPVAEALVSRATGQRLGLDGVAPTLLVAVDDDVDAAEVADRVGALLGVEPVVVPDPRAPRAVAPAPPQGDTVWDLLASCESSGDWHANTRNGFYGGLQFLPESWWLVGGTGLPHEASREEQILRAERLLELQGWVAWPVCSIRVGLRPDPAAS